jgi:hypothetical protein
MSDFMAFKLWLLVAVGVAAFVYRFWMGVTGRSARGRRNSPPE